MKGHWKLPLNHRYRFCYWQVCRFDFEQVQRPSSVGVKKVEPGFLAMPSSILSEASWSLLVHFSNKRSDRGKAR